MQVDINNVTHAFAGNSTPLFRNLSTTLNAGSLLGLIGPSGSGKSTLMSIIAGWVVPASGEVVRRDVRKVSWVFQNPVGVPRRTALDHVAFPFITAGADRPDAELDAMTLLEAFGLGRRADAQYRHLSGGEAQRLMLARAAASGADLLMLDEPTSQLDSRAAEDVISYLRSLVSPDRIVLVATHDHRAQAECDQVINLETAS